MEPSDPSKDRILDAFEITAVMHGVQAASFARVAEIGGFHRTLIRHHFGSREALIMAALQRVVAIYDARRRALCSGVPDEQHLALLLDWYFAPFGEQGPPRIARVVDVYISLATTNPDIQRQLAGLYQGFIDALEAAFDPHFPAATAERRLEVAVLIVSLSYGRAGLETIGLKPARTTRTRAACDALLAMLLT